MREELDSYLCATFPKMFVNRHADPMETCMCWGFSCGDGWFNIINQLCQNIQHRIDWSHRNYKWDIEYNEMITQALAGDITKLDAYCGTGLWAEERMKEILEKGYTEVRPIIPQVVVEQVKEKFGTLRFYYQGGDATIDGMVSLAESMSGVMCEECGAPGTTNGGGWVRTLCEKHEAEYQARRNG